MASVPEDLKTIILKHTNKKELTINLDDNLIKDLGIDSITLVSILIDLESYFQIEIPENCFTVETLSSFKNIVLMIDNELAKVKFNKGD